MKPARTKFRERPAKIKFEMHQIHRNLQAASPSDLNEQLTSVVKLTSVSSTIGYRREYVLFFFSKRLCTYHYVYHIT